MKKQCNKCGNKIPINADLDSIEDMRAVQDRLGVGSIEHVGKDGRTWWGYKTWGLNLQASDYRIRAKHADTFDPDCMDFETWARAVIGRGMVCRCKIVTTEYDRRASCYSDGVNWFNEIQTAGLSGGDGSWGVADHLDGWHSVEWTAITKAQYAEETAPKVEPKPTPARYIHNRDHGINTVIDRKDGERAICVCVHSEQDACRIAAALNEKVTK